MNINIFNISLDLPSVGVGGAIGIIFALVTKIGNSLIGEFIREIYNKREAMQKRKNRLADQIIEICTEGSSVGFGKMPGSQRHIQHLANLIEGIEKTTADDLRKYLGLWVLCAIEQTPGPYFKKNPTAEDIKFYTTLQRQASVLENKILYNVRKWR